MSIGRLINVVITSVNFLLTQFTICLLQIPFVSLSYCFTVVFPLIPNLIWKRWRELVWIESVKNLSRLLHIYCRLSVHSLLVVNIRILIFSKSAPDLFCLKKKFALRKQYVCNIKTFIIKPIIVNFQVYVTMFLGWEKYKRF